MTTRGEDIASVIKRQIEEFGGQVSMVDVGTVVEVGDGTNVNNIHICSCCHFRVVTIRRRNVML